MNVSDRIRALEEHLEDYDNCWEFIVKLMEQWAKYDKVYRTFNTVEASPFAMCIEELAEIVGRWDSKTEKSKRRYEARTHGKDPDVTGTGPYGEITRQYPERPTFVS